jgi:hypothetical protein
MKPDGLVLASCVALGIPSLTAPSAIEVLSLSPEPKCCPVDGSPTDLLKGIVQLARGSASTQPEVHVGEAHIVLPELRSSGAATFEPPTS